MTAPDLTAREAVRARLGVVVLCAVVRNATSAITVRVAGTTHSVPAWEIADALDAMLDALVTAERERDAVVALNASQREVVDAAVKMAEANSASSKAYGTEESKSALGELDDAISDLLTVTYGMMAEARTDG